MQRFEYLKGKKEVYCDVCSSLEELEKVYSELKAQVEEYFTEEKVVKGLVIYRFREYKEIKEDEVGCSNCGKVYKRDDIKKVEKTNQGWRKESCTCPKCDKLLDLRWF